MSLLVFCVDSETVVGVSVSVGFVSGASVFFSVVLTASVTTATSVVVADSEVVSLLLKVIVSFSVVVLYSSITTGGAFSS